MNEFWNGLRGCWESNGRMMILDDISDSLDGRILNAFENGALLVMTMEINQYFQCQEIFNMSFLFTFFFIFFPLFCN